MAKYEEKIAKEIAKAKKRFGDSFDEAQFRATNPLSLIQIWYQGGTAGICTEAR